MSERLHDWIRDAIQTTFVRDGVDAQQLADRLTSRRRPSEPDSSIALMGATVVALCRVTQHVPGVRDWWATDEGNAALSHLGEPDEAWAALNERFAVPVPDALDPNWPTEKLARSVDVPVGLVAGDVFVVGNGEGSRYLVQVVQAEGGLQVELRGESAEPFQPWWWQAAAEAERLIRNDPESPEGVRT